MVPKPSKRAKGSARATLTKQKQSIKKADALKVGKKYSIKLNEKEFLTDTKIAVLNLPHKHKYWIGAKNGGKTRPVIVRMLGEMLEDSDVSALALKKYKTNATEKLHGAIDSIAREMRLSGYAVPEFRKGQSRTTKMDDHRDLGNNQIIEYASLEDATSTDGITAPKMGKFMTVHVEEPVSKKDKEMPSPEDFAEDMKVIKSNVDRNNTQYSVFHGKVPTFPTYQYTMNSWDDHPIIVEAEKHFPEDEFMDYAIGIENWKRLSIDDILEKWEEIKASLIENTTAVRTVDKESKAFIRMTLFANPHWDKTSDVYDPESLVPREEQIDHFWEGIKDAILTKNTSQLAIYLGLKKEKGGDGKTYNMELLHTGDTVKEIKDGKWKILGVSQAWDVDINRLFVNTPVAFGYKENLAEMTEEYKLFVLPQVSFPAYGDGNGANIPIYSQQLKKISMETLFKFMKISNNRDTNWQEGNYLYIDQNQGAYLDVMAENRHLFSGIMKAKKHGSWDIINRQVWMNIAMNEDMIMIDSKNETLLKNMRMSRLATGSDKRDESGNLNKLYDEINSMEYALAPWYQMMLSIFYD